MLLRRLSLSHVDKPRKRYEGYDANAKKDNGGQDHGNRFLRMRPSIGRGPGTSSHYRMGRGEGARVRSADARRALDAFSWRSSARDAPTAIQQRDHGSDTDLDGNDRSCSRRRGRNDANADLADLADHADTAPAGWHYLQSDIHEGRP